MRYDGLNDEIVALRCRRRPWRASSHQLCPGPTIVEGAREFAALPDRPTTQTQKHGKPAKPASREPRRAGALPPLCRHAAHGG